MYILFEFNNFNNDNTAKSHYVTNMAITFNLGNYLMRVFTLTCLATSLMSFYALAQDIIPNKGHYQAPKKEYSPYVSDSFVYDKKQMVAISNAKSIDYWDGVKPVLKSRCVICHGCYDAPCQLKMSSIQGIERGSNPNPVYDGIRLLSAPLTRLHIDGHSTSAWRGLSFYSVLGGDKNSQNFDCTSNIMLRLLA